MLSLFVEFEGEPVAISSDPNIEIKDVQGITLSDASINTTQRIKGIGGTVTNKFVRPRNIVITACPSGNVQQGRQKLYQYFSAGQPTTIILVDGDTRMKISGEVESVRADLYERRQAVQISVICPFPYFKDVDNTRRDRFTPGRSFVIQGQAFTSGTEFEIVSSHFFKRVLIYQTIYSTDKTKAWECELTGNAVQALFIRSFEGEKAVVGHSVDVVLPYSEWIKLEPGTNDITIEIYREGGENEEPWVEFTAQEYADSQVVVIEPIYYGGV